MRLISAKPALPNLLPSVVASSSPAAPPPTIRILCFSLLLSLMHPPAYFPLTAVIVFLCNVL